MTETGPAREPPVPAGVGADSTFWKTSLWQQFGAAIDMLDNAIAACPDALWNDGGATPHPQAFWYMVYHTLFFLDLSLSGSVAGFTPPAPYTLGELDPAGVFPDRVYDKAEMRVYVDHCRTKCRTVLAEMTDARASERCTIPWIDVPMAELHMYTLRHVQHHTGQLNLLLRQRTGSAPGWVARARVARTG